MTGLMDAENSALPTREQTTFENKLIYIYIKVAFKHLIIFHNSITNLVYLSSN